MKGYGLTATPKDDRDLPLEPVFGAAQPIELPKSYVVSKPLMIKDQKNTDMCTAFALTAVSEDQELVELSPEYTFWKTKQITGKPDDWGADLRSACKSGVQRHGGFLPVSRYATPVVYDSSVRDNAARGVGFSKDHDWAAKKYAKKTYFKVNAVGDIFDGMRSAMWQTRDEERSIFTGIDWRPTWNGLKEIEKVGRGSSYGHAIKIFGWESYRTEDFLLAQLSNGVGIGDKGIFKISREVINTQCTYGSYTLMDMPREQAEYELGKVGWFRYWLNSIFS